MKDALFTPWVLLPIALSVIFGILFHPLAMRLFSSLHAAILTTLVIVAIWFAYFMRARFLVNEAAQESDERSDSDASKDR